MRFMTTFFTVLFLTMTSCGHETQADDPSVRYDRWRRKAVERDHFPVFTNPDLIPAKEADSDMHEKEWVIGVSINGDARAYPVQVMGVHELGNDTVGGKPITVCW